jgi:hypothetical protein
MYPMASKRNILRELPSNKLGMCKLHEEDGGCWEYSYEE